MRPHGAEAERAISRGTCGVCWSCFFFLCVCSSGGGRHVHGHVLAVAKQEREATATKLMKGLRLSSNAPPTRHIATYIGDTSFCNGVQILSKHDVSLYSMT